MLKPARPSRSSSPTAAVFGYLGGHSFEAALVHTAPYAMGAFALCAVLSLLLPRTAVSGEVLTES